MNDVDDLLRADAGRWRAAQRLDQDLDAVVQVATHAKPTPRRAGLIVAAAAAVVLISGATALVVDRLGEQTHPATTSGPSASARPSTTVPPNSADLPRLGTPPAGLRALLASSGRHDRTFTIRQATGRGEISAVCIGGGTIRVSMPGAGGFDLDCTGSAAGTSLPTLKTTVTVSGVDDQIWRIAVFGR